MQCFWLQIFVIYLKFLFYLKGSHVVMQPCSLASTLQPQGKVEFGPSSLMECLEVGSEAYSVLPVRFSLATIHSPHISS